MNSVKVVLFILAAIACGSCNSNEVPYGNRGIYISVENETSDHIDSILVYAHNLQHQAKKLQLAPYEKKRFYLNMNDMGNGDGSWRILYKFRNANTKKTKQFGYYTSGSIFENWIELKINSKRMKTISH